MKKISAASASRHVFHVSPRGNDAWSGVPADPNATATDGPFLTVAAAQRAVRRLIAAGLRKPVRVLFRGGNHFLDETLVFKPQDSGTEKCPVVYAAYPGEAPILSGGRKISDWQAAEFNGKSGWVAGLPDVAAGAWNFTQLFVNGVRRSRPRLPRTGFHKFTGVAGYRFAGVWMEGPDAALFNPGDIQNWKNLDDVNIVALQLWFHTHHRIRSLDLAEHRVDFRAKSLGSLLDEKGGFARYYVENVFEAIDAGEFYLDRPAGKLYYVPVAGETPATTEVIAPRLPALVRFAGTRKTNVRHIRLENLAFRHAEWEYSPDDPGSIQASFKVPGAVIFEHAEHCAIYGCEVTAGAPYGIEVMSGCHDTKIVGCHVHDMGAGGVRVGHEWMDVIRETSLTKTPPRPDGKPMAVTVSDCVIHHCGVIYPSGIGVWVGNAGHCRIVHNHIFDMPYTGISCGWTWGYRRTATIDNRIEYNHVHHINWDRLLSDNAAIYALGEHPGGTIRGNHVHHIGYYGYGGWGLYPDEGTGEMVIEDNVVHNTASSGFFTHYGRDNVVRNNIFALPGEGPVSLGKLEPHRSTIFERNIVLWRDCQMAGRDWSAGNYEIRDNILWPGYRPVDFGGGMTLDDWKKLGQFEGTRIVDPLLDAPETGDMSLRKGSPALSMGFKPIDVTRAGPRFRGERPADFEQVELAPVQAGPIVRTRMKFRGRQGLTLTLQNVGDAPAAGCVELKAVAQEGELRVKGRSRVEFKGLKAGQTRAFEFAIEVIGQPGRAWVETRVTGEGLVPALEFLESGGGKTLAQWTVPLLKEVPPLTGLATGLASQKPLKVLWQGKMLGEVRAAVANDFCLLHVRVTDERIHRKARPYEASGVEVFSSNAETRAPNPQINCPDRIRQIVVAPAADGKPMLVQFLDGAAFADADGVKAMTIPVAGGYEVSMAIPFALMLVEPGAKKFLVEVVINTTLLGLHRRSSLFGSPSPDVNNIAFTMVVPT